MSRAPLLLSLLAAVVFHPTLSCGRSESASSADRAEKARAGAPEATKGVLVTVNGTPISEMDIRYRLKNDSHTSELTPEYRKNALETIIRQELFRQRAVDLGLDADPKYQEKLRRIEVQMNAFKRQELTDVFFRREIEAKAVISDTEAEKYFAQNALRIRTEFHVWQILAREEGPIEQALKDIENGTPFEDVAARRFPKLPKTAQSPWDLGYLKWTQVPKPWRNVIYDLKKGDVSGIIRGPRNRFWIIKLVDTREDREITFESLKPAIKKALRSEKIEQLREQTERELRNRARILYSSDPVGASGQ